MFDRFRSLSPRRQVSLIVAGAGTIGAVLIAIWFVFLHTPYEPLFTNLRAPDAATIIADLERKKISYRLTDGGTKILVPADLVDTTRLSVATEDLPLKGTVGFELFNKSDLGLTDFAQKINYQRALQGELARTIMSLDDVESARVHLSLGEGRIFREDRVPPKASVTLRMKAGGALSQTSAQGIQRLIAAAVPQLEPANVVILDEQGALVGARAQLDMRGHAASSADNEKTIDHSYESRVKEVLARAYPLNEIAVSIEAEIAPGDDAQALDRPDLNPDTRNFPLKVTLSPAFPLEADAQESARSLVAEIIGFDPSGDSITFGAITKPLPEVPADKSAPETHALAQFGVGSPSLLADEQGSLIVEFAIGALLLFALLGLFIAIWDARPRGHRLSAKQRASLGIKLHKLLEERAARVAA